MQTVKAQVITDGAAVYSKADFDSPVQDYLSYQTAVIISKRPYAGAGGLGLFHRVKYNGNKMGYITDTDIRVVKAGGGGEASAPPEDKKKNPSKAWEDEDGPGKAPLYLTRFFGGALAQVKFTERYSGRRLSDNMLMYGLRMTGPGTLFDGPPLDFNFWFSLQKPKYMNEFAASQPTGFLLFGDVMAMLPLIDSGNWLVSYGIGLMYVYTRYSIPVKNSTTNETGNFDSQEFRMGVDFDFGVARRIGKALVRGDIKYYYEKSQYVGYLLSVQMEY